MDDLYWYILVFVVLLLVLLLLLRIRKNKLNNINKAVNINANDSIEFNVFAQINKKLITEGLFSNVDLKQLSKDSWKFVNDIINEVSNKFSKKEQNIAKEIGRKLNKSGMIYQHVIEYGVKIGAELTKTVMPELNKDSHSKQHRKSSRSK